MRGAARSAEERGDEAERGEDDGAARRGGAAAVGLWCGARGVCGGVWFS